MNDSQIYAAIGEDGFKQLVGAFYRQVKGDPVLSHLYPEEDFAGAEQRLRDFLIYRFGGPQHYIEHRGHPRLRMRHAPFPVDSVARDRWLLLMRNALAECRFSAEISEVLDGYFEATANAMMNRE